MISPLPLPDWLRVGSRTRQRLIQPRSSPRTPTRSWRRSTTACRSFSRRTRGTCGSILFEGIDSQRGIAWRCGDSLSLREFLNYAPWKHLPFVAAMGASAIGAYAGAQLHKRFASRLRERKESGAAGPEGKVDRATIPCVHCGRMLRLPQTSKSLAVTRPSCSQKFSFRYGDCPYCQERLLTPTAHQCFKCGKSWNKERAATPVNAIWLSKLPWFEFAGYCMLSLIVCICGAIYHLVQLDVEKAAVFLLGMAVSFCVGVGLRTAAEHYEKK